jgi:hypothetical protein
MVMRRWKGGRGAALGAASCVLGAAVLLVGAAGTPESAPAAPREPAGPPAAPAPAAPRPQAKATPPGAGSVRLAPRARQLSTYALDARLEVASGDVTFQVPPAYQDKFAFWTGRMKGQKRFELYQIQTSTQERASDGTVPFKRILARFQLELEREGKPMAAYGSLQKDMTTHAWEGTLDALGNVKEIRRTQGVDNPEAAELWTPMVERLFPPLGASRDLAVGKGFTDVTSLPLPSPLKIAGLETIRVRMAREYILKDSSGGLASFEVRTTYALDPDTPPTQPGTTCTISGGGTGEATFDVRRGVFLATSMPTRMTIEIEAPLQPLEDQTEAAAPGKGTTRIDLILKASGRQTVRRYWGEEED